MNILIIGGTGNISSEVVDKLKLRGYDISIMTSGKRFVPEGVTYIRADRNDIDSVKISLGSATFDVVIDFVSFVPRQIEDAFALFRGRTRQFIFISSATVYQKPPTTLPIVETTLRSNPFWKYAQDKIACEELCEKLHSADFPVTIVRPSHTFGKTWIPSAIHHSDFTVASRILNRKPIIIHGNGESRWTLTAASDFAAGFVGLVGNENACGEAFHITTDKHQSWNEIYADITDIFMVEPVLTHIPVDFIVKLYPDLEGPLRGDKAENAIFDNSKIKRFVPGFTCKKSLKTALAESIEWFMADPSRQIVNTMEVERIENILETWRSSTL